MKMQLITITHKNGIDAGFRIKRELFDNCGLVDTAFCSVRYVERGFIASGFSSIHKPTIVHAVSNTHESIDDFVKAVFAQ